MTTHSGVAREGSLVPDSKDRIFLPQTRLSVNICWMTRMTGKAEGKNSEHNLEILGLLVQDQGTKPWDSTSTNDVEDGRGGENTISRSSGVPTLQLVGMGWGRGGVSSFLPKCPVCNWSP